MDINTKIKALAADANISMIQLCKRVNLSPQNINQKMKRDTLKYSDVETLLSGLGYKLQINKNIKKIEKPIDIHKRIVYNKDKKESNKLRKSDS